MLTRDPKNPELWRYDFRVSAKRLRGRFPAQDKRAAQREYERIKVEARRNAPARRSSSDHTMKDLHELDLERGMRMNVTDAQLRTISRKWAHLLRVFGPERPIYRITPKHIAEYVEVRQTEGVCGNTVRREISYLYRALKIAKRKEWIRDVPEADIEAWGPRSREKNKGKEHDPAILAAFLRALPQEHRDFYLVALLTGARAGELERMTPEQIEPAPVTARVRAQLRIDEYGADGTRRAKTGSRVVGLHDHALEALNRHRRGPSDPIFGEDPKDRQRRAYAARKACRAIGYDRTITLRDMRHAFATTVANEASVLTARDALGHTSVSTTNIYAHARRAKVLDASFHVASLLEDAPEMDNTKRTLALNLAE